MKILLLDIETAPNLAYVWGLFKENIPTARIVNSGYVLSWAAKWYGEREIFFDSVFESSSRQMLKGIRKLLDEADVVVHYNGTSFDIPTLNKEFLIHGFGPPSPYRQVDLYTVVKARFRFPSNKLDYVLQTLKLGRKVRHPGFEMWVACMAKDPKAWATMRRYNIGDVKGLERLYDKMKPWVARHPSHGDYTGVFERCPYCNSADFRRKGWRIVGGVQKPKFRCRSCMGWFGGTGKNARRMVALG